MAKGGAFERQISVELSEWWTRGKRSDIFWRSSMSGGRATVRARQNKTTSGHYGDVTAIDPIGQPFLDVFATELKNGYGKDSIITLLDLPRPDVMQMFEKWYHQAHEAKIASKSLSWLIIHRRLGRAIMAYMPKKTFLQLRGLGAFKYQFPLLMLKGHERMESVVAIPYQEFLDGLLPKHVKRLSRKRK